MKKHCQLKILSALCLLLAVLPARATYIGSNQGQSADANNSFLLTGTTNRTITIFTVTNSFIVTNTGTFLATDVGALLSFSNLPPNAIITKFISTNSVQFGSPPVFPNYPAGTPALASGTGLATNTTGYAGTFTLVQSPGFVRQLVVVGLSVADGTAFPTNLGGTFVFQYSTDGTNPTVNETRKLTDLTTVRDFNLLNADAYFRILFAPSRPVTTNEFLFGSTVQRKQDDGPFVRLPNQQVEEENSAMTSVFSYGKVFGLNGKSVNLRASSQSLSNNTETVLTNGQAFIGGVEDVTQHKSVTIFVASDVAGSLYYQSGKNAADFSDLTLISSVSRPYTNSSGGQNYVFAPIAQFYRIVYTNGSVTQTKFRLQTTVHQTAVGPILAPLATALADSSLSQQTRAVIVGKAPSGNYLNTPANAVGNLITADFYTEVIKTNVIGHILVNQSGYNANIASNVSETISDVSSGVYAFPAAAGIVTVTSSSVAADTSAGTGARTVKITGLDANYNQSFQTITLTAGVGTTTTNFLRIFRAEVVTAGSGGANAGTLTGTISAVNQFVMAIGVNRTMLGFYTIPAGYTGYLIQSKFSSSVASLTAANAVATCQMWIGDTGAPLQVRENIFSGSTESGSLTPYIAPMQINEKSDIRFDATPTAAGTLCSIRFDILLVANGS